MTPAASAEPGSSAAKRAAAGASSKAWVSVVGGMLCAAYTNAGIAGDVASDAKARLERMTRAAQTLNYDGTFVYRNGATIETMRIIHRSSEEGERERLVAMSGAAREVVRDGERVKCILPDNRSVVVAKSRPRTFPHSRLLETGDGFTRFYTLSVHEGERIAGRQTELVEVQPKDPFRYAHRLWLDRDSGLLLKSELIGEQGDIIEQLVYTNIDLPAKISDELLEPATSGAGYTWYRDEQSEQSTGADSDSPSRWYPQWLPDGFELRDRARNSIMESRTPVEHLMFSDGLASVSVFIEQLETTGEPLDGPSSMGAVNAYGSMVNGFQVTVVGEVPATTVERVSESIQGP